MQSGSILLGQYRPLNTFLHRLDTRAKILPVLLVLGLGLFSQSAFFYMATIGVLLAGLLASGITVEQLSRNLRPVMLLVAITFGYHLIFSGNESEVLLSPFGLPIRAAAVRAGFFFSLRLLLFVSMAFLVTLTSSPAQMAEAAAKLLRPLRRLGIPVADLSLILFIALRFIPILYEEFELIRHAQMVRGVRFDGSMMMRARRSAALLVPVFVAAVSRADDLALALQARGYERRRERSYYSRAKMGVAEGLFVAITTSTLITGFLVTG